MEQALLARPLARKVAAAVIGIALAAGSISLSTAPAHASTLPTVVDGMVLDNDGKAVISSYERTEVAPGLVHVKFTRIDSNGAQPINVLKATLSDSTVKLKYLTPTTVAGDGGTVSEMTDAAGAVAGVNLDRFDINNSWAAAGWGISDGEIIKSGNPDAAASVGMTTDGLGALVDLALEGAVTFDDAGALTITGINTYSMPSGGVTLYNAQWGAYSRDAHNGPSNVVEVWVADGKVTAVNDSAGEGDIPAGTQILVARKGTAAGNALGALSVGATANIAYSVRDDLTNVAEAGGAWHRILREGQAVNVGNDEYFTGLNPRTMIGFSADLRTAYFVVVDGRTAVARGMNFAEQAKLMTDLGAYDAINADGGGSSQMNIRSHGDESSSVVNAPSDGVERYDGDGMGFVLAQPSSGTLTGFNITPVTTSDNSDRVFTGLHRTLTATGHDEAFSAAPGTPSRWYTGDPEVASVSKGVVAGTKPGTVSVTAQSGTAKGETQVQVLDELTHLSVEKNVINLEKKDSSATIEFTGHDDQGFTAPVEAQDLTVSSSNPETFSVTPTADGNYTVTAIGESGNGSIVFAHDGVSVEIAVAVPLVLTTIDDFSDISGWTYQTDRAPGGSLVEGDGFEGSPSLKISYDFTQSTATRGAYAAAPGAQSSGKGGIAIPGRPQKLSMWIKGSEHRELLRVQVRQSDNIVSWLDGPGGSQSMRVTWNGWERVDFVVPETFAFPITFERVRVLETVASLQYKSSLEFSQLYAYLPPDGQTTPTTVPIHDSTIVGAGDTDASPLRVAVMSDAQFVAREPNSGAVQGAREALREVVASKPDVLIINGDFVDEASPADFVLAQQILDEELVDIDFPWYYVPGNHEIMGGAISNFTNAFGATNRSFNFKNTKFITLNSSTGKLFNDFSQLTMLRTQLQKAAADSSITGVVVFSHMPTNDPLATKASQMTDRTEAAMLDDWLQDFRADTGKSVAMVASHVGVFDMSRVDGVPYLVNGNSGKTPAASPEQGGFTGWTMLGINPAEGYWKGCDDSLEQKWFKAEVRTRVDALDVAQPAETLTAGTVFDLHPQVTQDGTRTFSLTWPSSYTWAPSDNVYIGDTADAPADAIASIDPVSQKLTALRTGNGSAELTVNGTSKTVTFSVNGGEIAVAGDAVVGSRVTATLGTWAADAQVGYQWKRDGVAIAGATESSYLLGANDLGAAISVDAVVSREGAVDLHATAKLGEVVRAAVQVAPTVTVSGDAYVGSTLVAHAGEWADGTTLTFEWLRDGVVIENARSTAYTLVAADRGARIQLRVTGFAPGYEDAVAASAATAIVVTRPAAEPKPEPVVVPPTVKAGTVKVSGTTRVGQKLSVVASGWAGDTVLNVRWLRDGKPIARADSRSYKLVAADRGHRISVQVIAAAPGKVSVTAVSAKTKAVAKGKITASKVKIKGTVAVGKKLTVTGKWTAGVKRTYKWYLGGTLVKSSSSAKYTLKSGDVGKRVTVTVKATKAGYAAKTTKVASAKRVAWAVR